MWQIVMLTCALTAPKCDAGHYATRVEGPTYQSEETCLDHATGALERAPVPEGFVGKVICVDVDGKEL